MARTARITKEHILDAAVALVRELGPDALNARSLAARLSCSTQPIFKNYASMQAVLDAVMAYAEGLYTQGITQEIEKAEYPPYKASGIGYIRFAMNEPQLFKLLFMRDRTNEDQKKPTAEYEQELSIVMRQNGLTHAQAEQFHLSMWIFVHGIAVMLATGYLLLDFDQISELLTENYLALQKQFSGEEDK